MRSPALALALLSIAAAAAAGEAATRPHVVLILADDLGRGDVGFEGGDIPTPHIDRIAAEGVRLEQFYALPVCAPTRAALLTGRYPIRYGLQRGARDLPLTERTLAQALREAGYRTAIVGKWDLGFLTPAQRPTRRGFDHQYGPYHASISYGRHEYLGGLDWHRDDLPLREEGYATDLLAAEAVRLIEGHDPAQPLFLYLAFNAPHAPLAAPKRCLARAPAGVDAMRRLYAGAVVCLDDAVGRVLDALDRKGMREHTLVWFASDNGGARKWGASNGALRGEKWTLYEGGVRVPAALRWPGVLPAGGALREPLHVVDVLPTLVGLAGGRARGDLPLDGIDAWPALAHGQALARGDLLLNVGPRNGALRRGDWKLLARFDPAGRLTSAELYDLASDPAEAHDLAQRRPGVARTLLTRLLAYRHAAAPPVPRPRYQDGPIPAVWGDPAHDPAP
jgi:arylsulfatase A-like enzyme